MLLSYRVQRSLGTCTIINRTDDLVYTEYRDRKEHVRLSYMSCTIINRTDNLVYTEYKDR